MGKVSQTTRAREAETAVPPEPLADARGSSESGGLAGGRLEELGEIIRAYNQVTENLQRSHEALRAQVARLQEELASTNAQLQRSKRLAALGEMAAGIAHEIRNPLGAISLYASMLMQDLPAETEAGRTSRQIAAAVRSLDSIVGDVLAFAREMRPRKVKLGARQVLERAVEAQRPVIERAGIVVRVEATEELMLEADADLLQQALVNLVRNAVEAMSGGGVLTLSARGEGKTVVLTVRDTGPGIEEENIERIFNPFFTTRNTGTGLGLAIVHRIVDAHGGTIAVGNDGGAVFEVVMPAAKRASGQVAEWPSGETKTADTAVLPEPLADARGSSAEGTSDKLVPCGSAA